VKLDYPDELSSEKHSSLFSPTVGSEVGKIKFYDTDSRTKVFIVFFLISLVLNVIFFWQFSQSDI